MGFIIYVTESRRFFFLGKLKGKSKAMPNRSLDFFILLTCMFYLPKYFSKIIFGGKVSSQYIVYASIKGSAHETKLLHIQCMRLFNSLYPSLLPCASHVTPSTYNIDNMVLFLTDYFLDGDM